MFWMADVLKRERGTTSFASRNALPLRFSYSKIGTQSTVWRVCSAFPLHPNAFAVSSTPVHVMPDAQRKGIAAKGDDPEKLKTQLVRTFEYSAGEDELLAFLREHLHRLHHRRLRHVVHQILRHGTQRRRGLRLTAARRKRYGAKKK